MTGPATTALAAASAVWAAAVAGRWWGGVGLAWTAVAAVTVAALAVWRGRPLAVVAPVVTMVVCGAWSGMGAVQREAAIIAYETPPGPIAMRMRLTTDPAEGEHGWWALAVADPPESGRPSAAAMLLDLDGEVEVGAGDSVMVWGRRASRSGRAAGEPFSGVVRVTELSPVPGARAPWWTAGNAVRRRTLSSLAERGAGRALLAGFLVGETGDVSEADLEAMRRSGLSHLVAVSGSNVALFLMLALVAAGPLASGPRRRAVVGLCALLVLVIATRWEASVVRASVMAALVLAGRVGGWGLDALTALAVTVVTVVLVSGELATDVGFALSVMATAGVVVGSRLRPEGIPHPIATAVGATLGAQTSVAPLLLAVFGAVPLMAPLTNLVAAPVVAASTTVGAIGVGLGWEPLISLAALGAEMVLGVARVAAGWPQLGWVGTGLALSGLVTATVWRAARPWLAMAAAVAGVATLVNPGTSVEPPAAVVLDVGQGDAILVLGAGGRRILVDGGPDPGLLEAKLSAYGVTAIDLVILTHVHADHAAGLEAVIGRRPVGELWFPNPPHSTPASRLIAELARSHHMVLGTAPVGSRRHIGELTLEVLGPVRRYASPNDQSIVVRVSVGTGPTLLLSGDIETFAQSDLAGVRADVLKVPHQGAATSDLKWLTTVGASRAVISVGPNDFGHPAAEVIAALRRSGAAVERTDEAGDIVIPLR